ncbi:MAG: cation transporter [Anaerolineales bacterium]|nr:cation transporter [Anaerolineales bacterium]
MAGHVHLQEGGRSLSRRLGIAAGLTVALVAAEAAAGLFGNSLALLTDAAHNVTDVIALGLSWYAMRLALRPADAGKTYGYHRAGILAALVNSTGLVLVALGIFSEAYRRLLQPPEVEPGILAGVGALAFAINLATALLIRRGSEGDLNVRSAFVHLMGDVFSTLGAVAAGAAIALTGWNGWDALAGALTGVLILWNAWGILRETVQILLEGAPGDVDLERLVADLLKVKGVRGVHDLHVWSITRRLRMLSAHVRVDDITVRESAAVQAAIARLLCDRYGIRHATLQMECENCQPDTLYCDVSAESPESAGTAKRPPAKPARRRASR